MSAHVVSFASKLKGERAALVYLVVAKSKGQDAWFVTELDRSKKALFDEAVKHEPLDLTRYGKVLFKGWGKEPTPDVMEKLKAEYNQ